MLLCQMPGQSHRGPLPPLRKEEVWLQARLARHVEALSVEVGERHVWRPGSLGAAAGLLEESLRGLGKVERESWNAEGEEVANLWVDLPGTALPEERVIVGAHYDTVRGSPGANDNATGLAALLELGRLLAGLELARTVRLAVFANGEQPFFGSGMGSRRHAAGCRARGETVLAALALDALGFYSTAPESQRFPRGLRDLYPATADFVAFVTDLDSRDLLRRCVASFRRHAGIPSEGIAGPRSQPGIAWSDHRSFWAEGIPALVVTDTSPFRYPHLHRPTDVAAELDLGRCARVVSGLARCVAELAGLLAP